jgi:hypothetical protein
MPLHRQAAGQSMSKHARPTRTVPALCTYFTSGSFSGLPPLATSRLPNSVTRLPRESAPVLASLVLRHHHRPERAATTLTTSHERAVLPAARAAIALPPCYTYQCNTRPSGAPEQKILRVRAHCQFARIRTRRLHACELQSACLTDGKAARRQLITRQARRCSLLPLRPRAKVQGRPQPTQAHWRGA